MKRELLKLLCCPSCKGDLKLKVVEEDQEIKQGTLSCSCGKSYPIQDAIPRFVQHDAYVKNFSYEWIKHHNTQLDSALKTTYTEELFYKNTGFEKKKLGKSLVLDAGCGIGRYAEIALNAGATVVGVDLSYAIDVAQENFGKLPHAHFVQADLLALPFKKGVFDAVYSIGVLHHTPNPKHTFHQLVPLLAPGGNIGIWVYPANPEMKNTTFWRGITTRLPPRVLYGIIVLSTPMYFVNKIVYRWKFLRSLCHALLPGALYHGFPFINDQPYLSWYALGTYDYYSPTYQSYHTPYEVFRWFEEAGLNHIRLLEPQVAVTGKR